MNWQTLICALALLSGFGYQFSSLSEPLNGTTASQILDSSSEDFLSPCHVEKSKVAELIISMNKTVRILNTADKYLECRGHDVMRVHQVNPGTTEFCSDARISMIQQELDDIAGRLFQLAIRIEEPSEAEVDSLDKRKFKLIYALAALRVTQGTSPCPGSALTLYQLSPLLEYLEYSLNNVIVLFLNGPRPVRSTKSSWISHQTLDVFSSTKSFTQLWESASLDPAAMSRALPQLIPKLLSKNGTDFYQVLNFVQALPTIENRVVGFRAIYEHVLSNLSEELQMMRLAELVNKLLGEEKIPACSPIRQTLDDLIHDLRPAKLIGKKASCQLTSVAYQKQLCKYDSGYPESAYLCSPTWSWNIEPKVELGKLVFRIGGAYPFFSAENNTNQYNKFQTNVSESYVLSGGDMPEGAEVNWKLVPLRGVAPNRFKVMTSESNGTLFAHKTAMNWDVYRRVLVANRGSEDVDYEFQADQWTLSCTAG